MPDGLTAALVGAGSRGYAAYGPYALAHPDEIRFVAVAEPNDFRRDRFAREHNIPREYQFRSWEDISSRRQIADVAIVCTMPGMHAAPTVAMLEAGYDVLLENPIAATLADCLRVVRAAELTGRLLQIGHVLRHSAFFSVIHNMVTSGRLGDIITAEHRENLPYWHMAHSFVRGRWRDSGTDGPMILTKCGHDLDILYWNLGPCARLSSLGSLTHFRAENAPPGTPERCVDGCPAADKCPWYAPRLYLDLIPLLHVARRSRSPLLRLAGALPLGSPRLTGLTTRLIPPSVSVVFDDLSYEGRLHALQTGPYGRCVYHCDNDVVDHQTVDMEFEGSASAILVMDGHSHEQTRTVRYDGTRATLLGEFAFNRQIIEIHDHLTGRVELLNPTPRGSDQHGGGDAEIMASFVRAVRDSSHAVSCARESLESHLMGFAAEESRLTGVTVNVDEFRRQAEAVPETEP